jgi:hypothetical protein
MNEKTSVDDLVEDIIKGVSSLMERNITFTDARRGYPLTVDHAIAIIGLAAKIKSSREMANTADIISYKLHTLDMNIAKLVETGSRTEKK